MTNRTDAIPHRDMNSCAAQERSDAQDAPVCLNLKDAFALAWPIMLGYIVLGLPCGILAQQAGLNALQAFFLSSLFYSGAGQYMISNMYLAGTPAVAIIAAVSLVNSRQMLYGAALSRYCNNAKRSMSLLYSATVTDETFAVNLDRFEKGDWTVSTACAVNIFSQSAWAASNVVGVVLGNVLSVPTALASFAMTSIIVCLLFSQKATRANVVAASVSAAGVFICKLAGLSGPAILIGAVLGVCAGIIAWKQTGDTHHVMG